MIRITAIVAAVTNKTAVDILWNMPLRVVYSYEHYYYLREGFKVRPKSQKKTLDDLVKNV